MTGPTTAYQELPAPPGYVGWEPDGVWLSVTERFADVAARYPERLAVADTQQRLSYRALNARANQLARALMARVPPEPQPIAIFMPHGVEMLLAIVAILKSGHYYVPLDPGYPEPRLQGMIADCKPPLVLVDESSRGRAATLWGTELILAVDGIADDLSTANPPSRQSPASYFNIIYTSGSTGRPKGVVQTHANVLFDTGASTRLLKINPDDRFALVVPFTFGASVSDIFGALLNGAAVLAFDVRQNGLVAMADWTRREAITVTHMVPTLFRQWLAVVEGDAHYPDMRLIKLGGETLLKQDLALFRAHFGAGCFLRNALGSTETYMATIYLMGMEYQLRTQTVPVGYPAPGREILVLNGDLQPLPAGEPGQIVVKTRHLFACYWQQPELTAATCLPDPAGGDARLYLTGDLGRLDENGSLEHLGRLDDMVKINGQRVELAAVESALRDLAAVQGAAVVAQQRPDGSNRLIAYLISRHEPPPGPGELRNLLGRQLPEYMIPAAFVFLAQFPLLPFGKINRRALPAPDGARPDLDTQFVAPQTPLETDVASLFAAVLGLDEVGMLDDFFALGGDSLLATRLMAQVQTTFQVQVPATTLFETPTAAAIAAAILAGQAGTLAADELAAIFAELDGLSDDEIALLLQDDEGDR